MESGAPAPFFLAVAATGCDDGAAKERLRASLAAWAGQDEGRMKQCKGLSVTIPQSGLSSGFTKSMAEAAYQGMRGVKLPREQVEVRAMPPGSHGSGDLVADGRPAFV